MQALIQRYPLWFHVGLPTLVILFGMQSVRAVLSMASFLLRDTFLWDTVQVGLLGLAIFSTAFLAAILTRLLGLRFMLIGTVVGIGVARVAMQIWTGATVFDFVFAAAGVILFALFLPAYVGYVRNRQDRESNSFPLGLLLGFSLDAALLGAYGTYDVSWNGGIFAILLVILLALSLWTSLWGVFSSEPASRSSACGNFGESSWAQLLPWLGFGPFLFLQMLLFQNLARLVTLTEWSYPMAFAWMLSSHAVGLLVVVWIMGRGQRMQWPLLIISGVVLIASVTIPSSGVTLDALLFLLGQISCAMLLAIIAGGIVSGVRSPGLVRTTVSHGLGMITLLALVFAYYAAFDIDLPYDNAVLPTLAGIGLFVCAICALRFHPKQEYHVTVSWLPAQVALTLVVIPLVWMLTWETPQTDNGIGFPVRIANYNLHNGFNINGHLGMEAIAQVIEAEDPDVVGLQEISRGWVISGSLDMLTWLSHRLDMPYIYGPATGHLWGNAMLSRYPILEWANVSLPPENLLLSRGYLSALIDLGNGQRLRVVTTHLHHVREDADIRAQQVQALLDFWSGEGLTVIMGDFNVRKDDTEAQMIRDAGLTDVVDMEGIEPGYTWPSGGPKYQIDYIWISSDLIAKDVAIPASEASDHLAVVATVLLK